MWTYISRGNVEIREDLNVYDVEKTLTLKFKLFLIIL